MVKRTKKIFKNYLFLAIAFIMFSNVTLYSQSKLICNFSLSLNLLESAIAYKKKELSVDNKSVEVLTIETIGKNPKPGSYKFKAPMLSGDPCDAVASGNTDSDGDGISDLCDLDNDNDGILDSVECPRNSSFSVAVWNIGTFRQGIVTFSPGPSATLDFPQNFTTGSGLITQSSSSYFQGGVAQTNGQNRTFISLSGLDSQTLDEALTDNDYIELTIDALEPSEVGNVGLNIYNRTDVRSSVQDVAIDDIAGVETAWFIAPDGVNFQSRPFYCLTAINSGDDETDSGVVDPNSINTANNSVRNTLINPGTIKVRVYFFGSPSPTGHIDDIQFVTVGRGNCDIDNDGIFNQFDVDSDNDGCNDVLESGGSDADGDGRLGDGVLAFDDQGQVVFGGDISGGYNGLTGTEFVATQVMVNADALLNKQVTEGNGTTFSITSADAESTSVFNAGVPDYSTTTNVSAGLIFKWYIGNPNSGGSEILASNTNYSGENTQTLTINDVTGLDASQFCLLVTHNDIACINEVNCAILSVNELPIATDDLGNTVVDTSVIIDVVNTDNGNGIDSDADGDILTVTDINGTPVTPGDGTVVIVPGGTAELLADGTIEVTPDTGNTSPIVFPYTVADGNGGSDTAGVTININNTAPVATDDMGITVANTPVVIDVVDLDNGNGIDFDVDGDTLTVTEINGTPVTPGDGTVVIVPGGTAVLLVDGTIEVIPDTGNTLPIVFPYTVADGNGGSDTAQVTINFNNTAPVATDDIETTVADMPVVIDVVNANNGNGIDSDVDGDTLTVTEINGTPVTPGDGTVVIVPGGTAILLADGTIEVTPDTGNTSPIVFPYTIADGNGGNDSAEVIINFDNTAPVATNDIETTVADTPVVIDVVNANNGNGIDLDADGDTLIVIDINGTPVTPGDGTVVIVPGGTAILLADGTIEVTPDTGNTLPIVFPYTVADGNGGSDTAQVTINIDNTVPIATDDTATTVVDTPVVIDVVNTDNGNGIDSDADGDTLTVTDINGTPVTPGDGTVVIVPGGTALLLADGTIEVTPDTGNMSPILFPYTITDGNGGSDTAQVTINFNNTAPVATDDTVTTDVNTLIVIDVVNTDNDNGIDSDADGDTLTVSDINGTPVTPGDGTVVIVPGGTAVLLADGTIEVTPDTGNTAPIVFPYTVTDGNGGIDTAEVTINIDNTAPIATDDTVTTALNTPVVIDVVNTDNGNGIDSDVDGDTLTVSDINGTPVTPGDGTVVIVPGGTAILLADGTIEVTPDAGNTAPIVFPYTIADGNGGIDTAEVVMIILACPSPVDTDGDGLTDCEETTGIDDPSTLLIPGDFGVTSTNPSDPNNPCDPLTGIACETSIEVTKTASFFGDDLGDTIEYTITVENTSQVTITNVVLMDQFSDRNGTVLSLTQEPTFVSSDQGSVAGLLLAGEIATYRASFIVNQQALGAGGVSNSVTVSGTLPNLDTVTDVSDDGDDSDGNTLDDPTVTDLGCLLVFNEFSPNGDGVNDVLSINCIENYPNNNLQIYNRWGNIVFKKRGYNNDWDGTSNGRATIKKSQELPVGTYYYILDFGDGSKPKVGWLYLNR